MKVNVLLALALISFGASASVDDVKASFKASHVDGWTKKNGVELASHADKYRILNVKLSANSGAVKVDFTDLESDQIGASEGYCWRLAGLAPLVMPSSWSEQTPDEQALAKIYTGDLASGSTRSGVINGWSFTFGRVENTIYCSANKVS
ncbi:TPA: hypothetical protein P2Q98_000231 [Aeromonas veronii]|uniref:hypothetical protein n=1 Tax=Aeromonas veronii TaxID=654 RepID=UPI003312B8BD|nr:hypothetical protein [Aeromonas veronii]HDO1332140.1 hypothetical protein [Aeromonas veronii]HDO1339056.1 hypothetical protein [Aeromonas veronii]HDO1341199.1 hypothetical protein [Aeromonas veronii]HDO1345773.1 hypothetical protein [Aeromonas veronii]